MGNKHKTNTFVPFRHSPSGEINSEVIENSQMSKYEWIVCMELRPQMWKTACCSQILCSQCIPHLQRCPIGWKTPLEFSTREFIDEKIKCTSTKWNVWQKNIEILEFYQHKQKCEERLLKMFLQIDELHKSELKQINTSLGWSWCLRRDKSYG